jgi:hypothetical protein
LPAFTVVDSVKRLQEVEEYVADMETLRDLVRRLEKDNRALKLRET